MGPSRKIHAAIFGFMASVAPPIPMLGRSIKNGYGARCIPATVSPLISIKVWPEANTDDIGGVTAYRPLRIIAATAPKHFLLSGAQAYTRAMSLPILYDHAGSICSQMARLALVEKAVPFERRAIDIMETNEQFKPWYVALNPKAVVPTLAMDTEIVTDTIRIVNRVQTFDGPDLSGDATTQGWLKDIMAPHYGVLLYRNRLDPDGTAPQIIARGLLLDQLLKKHPEMADLLEGRIAGNRRFQTLLRNPDEIEEHLASTKVLVGRMAAAVKPQPFLAGSSYSLADCFATAALARFTMHRLQDWWRGTALEDYYQRMKARPSFETAKVMDAGSERDL